ncbi:hypothetical protein SAMN04515674_104182 [Pseudarcicella hirudinis]|uniref:Uncharacterized protein n=2 Tax=Pseudarcicella hirudinis TaxID=1079859 RepID=A0A1I5RPS8_9BACT|nr:hypothetical protein [Pseudarcicella hirudinis]SFP60503.1 hypothetical protein SAMN04515674_104182 [Pseudarcicella hirudinis]
MSSHVLFNSIAGFMAVIFWFVLFCLGTLVDSKPFRDHISGIDSLATGKISAKDSSKTKLSIKTTDSAKASVQVAKSSGKDSFFKNIFIIMLTWTPTNVGMLSLVAGLIGGLGRKLWRKSQITDEPFPTLSGTLIGFVIYIVFISGTFLTIDNPFGSTTPGQYVRTAGILSLFSFMSAYEPNIFKKITGHFSNIENHLSNDNPITKP